jgi:hypothetical protein
MRREIGLFLDAAGVGVALPEAEGPGARRLALAIVGGNERWDNVNRSTIG